MTLKIEKYQTKPILVDAVRVTAENIEEAAYWCGGDYVAETNDGKIDQFIKVDVHRPISEKHTKARVGDWLLKSKQGTKIYTDKSKKIYFEPVFREPAGGHKPQIHMDSKKVNRSAETGEFVSEKEAEANPATTVTETVQVAPTGQSVIAPAAPQVQPADEGDPGYGPEDKDIEKLALLERDSEGKVL